jgi:hypothetical protein
MAGRSVSTSREERSAWIRLFIDKFSTYVIAMVTRHTGIQAWRLWIREIQKDIFIERDFEAGLVQQSVQIVARASHNLTLFVRPHSRLIFASCQY